MWPTEPLGSLVQDGEISYGIVQPGRHEPTGVPIVRVKDLRNGRISVTEPLKVAPRISEKHKRTVLRGGELLISVVGSVGEAAVVPSSLAGWNVARAVAVIRPVGISSDWVRYSLQMPAVAESIRSMLNTTVQATLNLADLKRLEIPMPTKAVQRAIAEVLGALDDKIAANGALTESLGRMVDHLFISAQAGAIGSVNIGDVAKVTKGVSYRRHDLDDESKTAMVTLKSITRTGRYSPLGLKGFAGDAKPAQIVSPGESIVAQTDLTQAAEVVGRAVRVPASERFERLVASLDLAIVRPLNGIPQEYLLGALRTDAFRDHCRSRTSGTTVLHLGRGAIESFEVPWLPEGGQLRYAATVAPMFTRIDSADRETEQLVMTRDALLPGLMSGKIRVKDAEQVVGEAV